MTQTYRQAPGQRIEEVRCPGWVYGHDTRIVDRATGLPLTGDAAGVEYGYVGKTERGVEVRDAEHEGTCTGPDGEQRLSPWRDLSTGGPYVIEYGLFTRAELLEREAFHIRQRQPRYNDRGNESRTDRIRKREARRHRNARQVAAGLPPIRWPEERRVTVDPVVPSSSRWWPILKRIARHPLSRWLTGWLVLAVAVWFGLGWAAVKADRVIPGPWHAGVSAVIAAIVVGRLWWSLRGRRAWRRLKRRWFR